LQINTEYKRLEGAGSGKGRGEMIDEMRRDRKIEELEEKKRI
jgi:hypothetical protein